jgi:hypothetical protein
VADRVADLDQELPKAGEFAAAWSIAFVIDYTTAAHLGQRVFRRRNQD